VLDNFPPTGSANVAMILDQSNLDQSFEVVVEIVAVNTKGGLKLNCAHFVAL
jgi:hypothetical protein